jgi:hypothetical protein
MAVAWGDVRLSTQSAIADACGRKGPNGRRASDFRSGDGDRLAWRELSALGAIAQADDRLAFLQRDRGDALVDLDIDDRAANADRGDGRVDVISGLRRISGNETERSLSQIENRLGITGLAAAGEDETIEFQRRFRAHREIRGVGQDEVPVAVLTRLDGLVEENVVADRNALEVAAVNSSTLFFTITVLTMRCSSAVASSAPATPSFSWRRA